MTDLTDLIHVVVRNPKEDAPKAMLADHLLEQGDGRGELIRRRLEQPHLRLTGREFNGRPLRNPNSVRYFPEENARRPDPPEDLDHNDDAVKNKEAGLSTHVSVGPGDEVVGAVVPQLATRDADPKTLTVPYHPLYLKTDSTAARQIADTLPNSEEVHQFLTKHFGPDPRYNASLNKALKPETE